jgi:hypothetical protein
MKKLFLSCLLAIIVGSIPAALLSINHPLKKYAVLKKLIQNPKYIYEYTTESGDTITIDSQKMLLLASATSYHNAGRYPLLHNPWVFYSTVVNYGIARPCSLLMVYQDWKIGFMHLIGFYAINELSESIAPHSGPTFASASLYILQSLYTGKWLPWTYRNNTTSAIDASLQK